MTSLQALAERLEKATGPSRELDAALHVALVKPEQYPDDLRYFRLPSASMDHMDMCAPGTYWLKQRSGASLQTAPTYSASLDAAIALCERVLPDNMRWSISNAAVKPRANVFPLSPTRPIMGPYSSAATPALALCLAIVRARIAEETP